MPDGIHKTSKGFTLIEILITLVIVSVIMGIGTVGYNNYTKRQVLIQEGLKLKDALRNAQTSASSGAKPLALSCGQLLGYEMDFTNTGYTVVAKCSPDQPNVMVVKTDLNAQVIFSPIPVSILFKVLNQGIQATGVNSPADAVTITLQQISGLVSYKLSVASDGSVTSLGLQ